MKLSTLLIVFTILHSITTSLAQSPAQAPAPAGPLNVTKILEKAGQFTMFIRLLKNTQVADQINTQLNNSNQGMTLFAPPDNAFSNLKSGTLNSLTDQEKVELIQFHVIPTFMSLSQFQTVSNPLRTQAGNADSSPLNVTTGGNQVNITTGVVDTTVSNTIYTDNKLAVYQVDQVLLPNDLFGAPPPALAPKPEKGSPPSADSPASGKDDSSAKDTSGAKEIKQSIVMTVGIAVVFLLSL
ncbi:Fasciclin-like arabinogalactan protein 11 [Ranunculus cassubicifolius]